MPGDTSVASAVDSYASSGALSTPIEIEPGLRLRALALDPVATRSRFNIMEDLASPPGGRLRALGFNPSGAVIEPRSAEDGQAGAVEGVVGEDALELTGDGGEGDEGVARLSGGEADEVPAGAEVDARRGRQGAVRGQGSGGGGVDPPAAAVVEGSEVAGFGHGGVEDLPGIGGVAGVEGFDATNWPAMFCNTAAGAVSAGSSGSETRLKPGSRGICSLAVFCARAASWEAVAGSCAAAWRPGGLGGPPWAAAGRPRSSDIRRGGSGIELPSWASRGGSASVSVPGIQSDQAEASRCPVLRAAALTVRQATSDCTRSLGLPSVSLSGVSRPYPALDPARSPGTTHCWSGGEGVAPAMPAVCVSRLRQTR